ncbi:hypothetical protein ACFY6U_31685 [Streptomyces sp. NPDC013157]|uniref:hypothetical protein n=1 Tax=Streptomyces sp. NPDC013157 TaxID=3364861 RepID=UPI0036A0B3FE
MTTPPPPRSKSLTATPDDSRPARPAGPEAAVGEPKGAARKGVVAALRADPQPVDPANPTPDRPGIRIYAPPVYRHPNDGARWSKRYGDTPRAAYACGCGLTDTATGAADVAALITDYEYHRAKECTGASASLTEGRAAA